MGCDIELYRQEVRQAYEAAGDECFLDNKDNIACFSQEQRTKLSERLQRYGYRILSNSPATTTYTNGDSEALLTDRGVYFSAPWGDSVFDMLMTASEFTDSGEFAKFDPQTGQWE